MSVCTSFLRCDNPQKQTVVLGEFSSVGKIGRLSVWKVRTGRELNTLETTTTSNSLVPLPRNELCLLVPWTWFEAYIPINDDTSSINILDYYQCLGEILLAAAVHWELIDMTYLLYMNLEKSLPSEWFNSFYVNYKLCQETQLWMDLFPALRLRVWAVCTSDTLHTLTLTDWLTP